MKTKHNQLLPVIEFLHRLMGDTCAFCTNEIMAWIDPV